MMLSLQRDRLAAPVVLVYSLLLATGLGVYTSSGIGNASSLWIGTTLGTCLGVILALHRLRWWVMGSVVLAIAMFGAVLLPFDSTERSLIIKAFIPAGMCAYACLSDRHALVAMWFPTVIWMLTILDRSHGHALPDDLGIGLLGGLAVMFVIFLRARESRRIKLWMSTSTRPVATMARTRILREAPGRPVLRAGWTFAVTALAFGFTAWLAPKLWNLEAFSHTQASRSPGNGSACCPTKYVVDKRSRVGEYFGGRTHTDERREIDPGRCVVCKGRGAGVLGAEWVGDGWYPVVGGSGGGGGGGGGGNGIGGAGDGDGPSSSSSPRPMLPDPSPRFQPHLQDLPPSVANATPMPTMPLPVPQPQPQPTPTPAPTPMLTPQVAPTPAPAATPRPQPPQITSPSTPSQTSDADLGPDPTTPRSDSGLGWLRWLIALTIGAMSYVVVGFALRPLRRAITLRHLRAPFWEETVDQRISNAWQLALIGLRDAGCCTSDMEAPAELVRRANVDGLDRCATILDRARYGIALGPDDVNVMLATADAVYRSARKPLGMFARLAAAVRNPLV